MSERSMQKQTRSRTLSVIVTLMLFVAFNTALQLLDQYSEWFAWVLYAVMVAAVAAVLYFQQRLSLAVSLLILALPFALGLIGVLLGV
ncbi:MAG: hypothetical protein JOZ51_15790 [Chloroflexi bacterium]|nr:hypothetical protein [Chloroflexota bacterium]